MFEIEVYRGSTLREGALKALHHRLFQNGWLLGGYYRDIRDRNKTEPFLILIAILDGKPVGSAAVFDQCFCDFQIFVRKRHRRKGIGSALYARAMQEQKRTEPLTMTVDHSRGAEAFYNVNRYKQWFVVEPIEETETIEVEEREYANDVS